jgi:hypothetical protein
MIRTRRSDAWKQTPGRPRTVTGGKRFHRITANNNFDSIHPSISDLRTPGGQEQRALWIVGGHWRSRCARWRWKTAARTPRVVDDGSWRRRRRRRQRCAAAAAAALPVAHLGAGRSRRARGSGGGVPRGAAGPPPNARAPVRGVEDILLELLPAGSVLVGYTVDGYLFAWWSVTVKVWTE